MLGENPTRRLIASKIVPSIARMMQAFPICMTNIFPGDTIQLTSGNLQNTDLFFDGVVNK